MRTLRFEVIALVGACGLAGLAPGGARAQICDDRFPSTCERPAVQETAPPAAVPQRVTAPRKPRRTVSDDGRREIPRVQEPAAVTPADEPSESSAATAAEEPADLGPAFAEAAHAINATSLAGLPGKTAVPTSKRQSLVLAATTAWIGQPLREHMVVASERSRDAEAAKPHDVAALDEDHADPAAADASDGSAWTVFVVALLSGTLLLALAGWLLVAPRPVLAVLPRRRQNGGRSAPRPRLAT